MIKRATWFATGAVAGVVGANYAKNKVKAKAAQMSPSSVARTAAVTARDASRRVADAVREGRAAMNQHEDELRARREGRLTSLDEHVSPDDQVFVDGVPVESGRVIVMRRK
jgi:hypothetical protein